jgi:hypothetical protein
MKRIPLFALLPMAALAVTAACSPVRGFCEAAAECDDREAGLLDFVGESNDSVNVCIANEEGTLRVLRANEEEGCQEEADARLAYFACVADAYRADPGDACDGFVLSDDRNPCFSELDDFFDAAADNGDDCSPNEE